MAEEMLNKVKVNYLAICAIVKLFRGSPYESVLVASNDLARQLSGSFIDVECKNGKSIMHSDGINAGYLNCVLNGEETGKIVFSNTSKDRIDMSIFRPKESVLSGTFYANDPGTLSSDGQDWYFILGQHSDPNGARYQAVGDVYDNLQGMEVNRVYSADENLPEGLSYFRQECKKNSEYIDQMIKKGKIKSVSRNGKEC